ncbi:MAG: sugar phosphate isomerase/epimerase family protein [Nitrososphaerales archaeon]
MLVGLSTLYSLLKGDTFSTLLEELNKNLKNELMLWEIVDDGEYSLNRERVSLLKKFLELDVRFTVHSPWNNLNIASLDDPLRAQSVRRVKESIDYASNLEALNIVIHPGSKPSDSEKMRRAKELNEASLTALYDYASSCGIRASIENMIPLSDKFLERVEDFKEFYLNTKINFPITFDVAHAFLGGMVKDFLKELAKRFCCIHVSDNRGSYDEHLCIGDGNINWKEIILTLKASNPSAFYIIESVKEPFESFKRLKKML